MSLDDVYRTFAGTPKDATCPTHVPPPTRVVEPLGHMGHVGHHKDERQQEEAGPLHEIAPLLAALVEAGHDLGIDLEARIRRSMVNLSRQERAELAAAIDDAFEASVSIEQARLSISRHLPGGGDLGPASAEWWVSWVASRCPINADDRRYLGDLLRLLPDRRRATAACWYSRAWLQAADAEPLPHRRENAGRQAANTTLRPVRRGGGQ
ncbi:hypothetical protein HOP61_17930 [Halomonas daqingensis]|uniref:Uncharacterized protein n=1 Tax=Billgrantia desiderata TaxID=52021 RepID=A0AAW4YY22_9GAMM|nr:hypothetical protein [Halomonas desiderata]MCE8053174.1 hypothetical protein [Halomonas desiderata]